MSATGFGRAGGRERRLAAARRAFGTLSPAQRRVLALRYVSGLSADEIASQLDLAPTEVDTLLATGRHTLLRTRRHPYARPLALTAAAAALALVALPHAPSFLRVPGSASPAAAVPVVGGEPLAVGFATGDAPPAADAAASTVARARSGGAVAPEGLDPRTPRTPRTPGRSCRTLCVPQPKGHTLAVTVPEPAQKPVGQKELVLEQEHVPLCDAFPTPPAGGARCVPAST